MPIAVERIYRFPVKGLGGEALESVPLIAGQGVPHDRRFAVARGDTKMDAAAPRWLPKQWFVMLMRDTELARVACRIDAEAETIELRAPAMPLCLASPATADGRERIESYLNEVLGPRREGRAHFVESGEASFTDVPQNCLSLVNLASIGDLESRMGAPIHPLRFRANLYIDGAPPWAEFDWIGGEIHIGDVTLRIPARIPRCAATGVDPDTGKRDVNVVKGLRAAYGHYDMGVYAEVVSGGRVAIGDTVIPPGQARPRSRIGHWMRFFGFLAESAPIVLRRK